MSQKVKFERILLKISGESLSGPSGFGVDPDQAESLTQLRDLAERHARQVANANL